MDIPESIVPKFRVAIDQIDVQDEAHEFFMRVVDAVGFSEAECSVFVRTYPRELVSAFAEHGRYVPDRPISLDTVIELVAYDLVPATAYQRRDTYNWTHVYYSCYLINNPVLCDLLQERRAPALEHNPD